MHVKIVTTGTFNVGWTSVGQLKVTPVLFTHFMFLSFFLPFFLEKPLMLEMQVR